MEHNNAFIGEKKQPTVVQVTDALGPAAHAWQALIDWAQEQGITGQEWSSVSPKYGWALRLKAKKRNIVYLGPCRDCFRASFVLGARAVEAARASELPEPVLQALNEAPCYAEGTGLRLLVQSADDLPAIRKLVEVKLAN